VRALRWAPALLAVAPLWAQSRDDAPSADAIVLTHFAVEQGDATLISTPAGRHILIATDVDAGALADKMFDAGVATLDLVIATNDRGENVGDRVAVKRYASPRSQDIEMDGVSLTVLPPALNDAIDAQNERGVLLRYGDFSALYPGEAKNGQLTEWIANDVVGRVNIVTAPDHGSTSGVNWRWMTTVQPTTVIISAGQPTTHAYVSWLTVELWKMLQAEVLRTDRLGDVRISAKADGTFSSSAGTSTESGCPDAPDPRRSSPRTSACRR
jgi:beta-lactamase superfamily II metal-dependent hydrolase